jgi:hypothetical protein
MTAFRLVRASDWSADLHIAATESEQSSAALYRANTACEVTAGAERLALVSRRYGRAVPAQDRPQGCCRFREVWQRAVTQLN